MKDRITCFALALCLLCGSLLCLFREKPDFSESERRVLAKFPETTAQSFFSGDFADGFEEYATDTFPFREYLRSVKAHVSRAVFNLSDNNGIFKENAHITKLDYPLNMPMLDHAAERFDFINRTYLEGKNTRVFLSIIPDKNYFLDVLKLDYEKLCSYMREKMPYASYIDIFPKLELEHYYLTDSHWRQNRIYPVAETIANALGADISATYSESFLPDPFYGVYAGQSALKVMPDSIIYLENDTLSSCTVTSFDTGKPEKAEMYDMEKAKGRDPYEMFLSGGSSLLTIENPNAKEKRELVIFRDSFASSLAPLLVPGYSKITLVDIRYIQSAMLGNFVDFENADVLFLYSTSMLNASLAFK